MAENKNNPIEVVTQLVAAADVDTDASGDVDVVISELRTVESAIGDIRDGFKAVSQSITGNVVTFRIFTFDYDAGADGPAIAHTSENNIAIMNVTAFGRKK